MADLLRVTVAIHHPVNVDGSNGGSDFRRAGDRASCRYREMQIRVHLIVSIHVKLKSGPCPATLPWRPDAVFIDPFIPTNRGLPMPSHKLRA
jgi:hypothetical protein